MVGRAGDAVRELLAVAHLAPLVDALAIHDDLAFHRAEARVAVSAPAHFAPPLVRGSHFSSSRVSTRRTWMLKRGFQVLLTTMGWNAPSNKELQEHKKRRG